MGKKSTPSAPDPVATANAQASANKEAVTESARVNQIGTWGPQGRTYYTGEIGSPERTQVTELAPEQQALYDQQMQLGQSLGTTAQGKAEQISNQGAFSYGGMPSAGTTSRIAFNPDTTTRYAIETGNVPALQQVDMNALAAAPWQGDRSAQIDSLEAATYDRAYNRMLPEINRQRDALTASLANQGIAIGSEAYNAEMNRFDQNLANQLNDLSLGSVSAGRAEDSRLYNQGLAGRQTSFGEQNQLFSNSLASNQNQFGQNAATTAFDQSEADRIMGAQLAQASFAANEDQRQFGNNNALRAQAAQEALAERQMPMNELAAILQGSPAISSPQAVNPGQYNVAAPDLMGATYANYNAQMQNSAANRQGLYGLLGTGAMAGAYYFSDRRLKRDIRKIGALPNGLGVYKYRYTWSDDDEVGLMADEVKAINPAAVMTVGSHDMVNYAEAVQ